MYLRQNNVMDFGMVHNQEKENTTKKDGKKNSLNLKQSKEMDQKSIRQFGNIISEKESKNLSNVFSFFFFLLL